MATVNEVAFKYAAKGQKAVQRADKRVRDSVTRTAKTAQKNTGQVNRWMEANTTALKRVGMAAAGAMAGILAQSPTLRAELSSVRIAMSLLADDIINTLFPNGMRLGDMAFRLVDGFNALPDPIQRVASAIAVIGTVTVGVLTGVSAFLKILGGGGLLPVLKGAGVAIVGFAASIGFLLGVIGVAVLQMTGVMDRVRELGQVVGSVGSPALHDFGLSFLAVATVGLFPLMSAVGAFITGFLEGGIPEGVDRAQKALGVFRGAIDRTVDRVTDWFGDVVDRAKEWGVQLIANLISGLVSARSRLLEWLAELRSDIETRLGVNTENSVSETIVNRVNTGNGGGGGGSVSVGDINIDLQGTGASRTDAENIADEVSRAINDQFEARR